MKYISTRGGIGEHGFQSIVLMGLADDGGLILPVSYPDVSANLKFWQALPFPSLALEVMAPFVDLPRAHLEAMIASSYRTFTHHEITPVVRAGGVHILELFHGPTLAFKDVALQFLGNLFEYALVRSQGELNVVVATSGDTGSAAIEAVRGKKGMRIFVLHPKGRISALQERQMTSVLDGNVFNIAVAGTFDDCQRLVKDTLQDVEFKHRHSLGSVNSINWARLLAQVVYYFYAALRVCAQEKAQAVSFAVPTGNFGDIFAGYIAQRMGAPIRRLILATNENDILSRFFNTGLYKTGAVQHTISPSMDIQVASNFERFLYYAVGESPVRLAEMMRQFSKSGEIVMDLRGQGDLFRAGVSDRAETLKTIGDTYRQTGYTLDPHTAVGVSVGRRLADSDCPLVCLATAHPAKFPDAVFEATGITPTHPVLERLKNAKTRCVTMDADVQTLRAYIEEGISHSDKA